MSYDLVNIRSITHIHTNTHSSANTYSPSFGHGCSWEEFTDAVVKELRKRSGLVYLLWGKPAQNKYAL